MGNAAVADLAVCLGSVHGLTMLGLRCQPLDSYSEVEGVAALAGSIAGMHHLQQLQLHIYV